MTVIKLQMCSSVPNFIKIGRFFVEVWQQNDFQYGLVACKTSVFDRRTFPVLPQTITNGWPLMWVNHPL